MPSDGICVLVPQMHIGRVIGKGGNEVKKIREQTRCSVEVAKEESWNQTRQVSIVGSNEDVADAFAMVVAKAFSEDPENAEGMVALPVELAGKAIGKGGQNLKEIRNRTQCHVVMEKEPIALDREGAQARVTRFKGGPQQMAAGLRMLISYLTSDGPGGPPPGRAPPPPAFNPPPPQGYGDPRDHYGRYGHGGGGLPPAPQWAPPPGPQGYSNGRPGPGRPTQRMPPPPPMHGPPMHGGRGMPEPGPLLSKIQQPGQDPGEMQVHMTVPEFLAGNLIGKGGEKVKQYRESTGCRTVIMSERNQGPRRLVMVGGFNEVVASQKMVYDAIQQELEKESKEPLSEVECLVLVRREACGKLIGKGGENLSAMRDETKLNKFQIDRDEQLGFRVCTLRGSLNDVINAQKLIIEIVENVPIGGEQKGQKRMADGPAGGPNKVARG